ncbi:Aspartate--tRNA(Asp) ligase [subsurface metagenome]
MKDLKYTTIEESLKQEDSNVNLRGWVYRERKSNKFVFIVLRDESDIIQCVISKAKSPEIFEKAEKLTIESSCFNDSSMVVYFKSFIFEL